MDLGHRVDDVVKGAEELAHLVGVCVRHDLRAQRRRFCLFGKRPREDRHLGAHGHGQLDGHHAQAAEAHDAHRLVLLALGPPRQGRVRRHARAAQRARVLELHALGHRVAEALMDRHAGRVAAVRPSARALVVAQAFGELRRVRLDPSRAVLLEALGAGGAVHARADHAADCDLVADLELSRCVGTNGCNNARQFMASRDGVLVDAPFAVDRVQVGVTHAAILQRDGHVVRARRRAADLHARESKRRIVRRQHEGAFAADDGSHGFEEVAKEQA
mmetsp:Transcript_10538/g.37122  ORF Transcript_10538/g.37122 Transcript_10538/m.37122 type:complete len:274 (+) Transcript_10538:508-1329(+)